jgi:hypothetical protein
MGRALAVLGLIIGVLAVATQFAISLEAYMASGRSFGFSFFKLLSFFTITTNILLLLAYLGYLLPGARWLSLFRKPIVVATAAASIALVGVYYHVFLAAFWKPEGLFYVCDILLHYVTPILFVVWFAGFNRTGTLRFSALLPMQVYPLGYLAWVLIRGAVAGDYPYPSLDLAKLGIGGLALNCLIFLVLFLVLDSLAILIDRFSPNRQR